MFTDRMAGPCLKAKFLNACSYNIIGLTLVGTSIVGSTGTGGYFIFLGGTYDGGSFNETTGVAGVIGTATSNLSGTLTWSIEAGGDSRISINSSTGAVSTSAAIYSGDSATFTVQVTNGTFTVWFPYTAVGTVSGYEAETTALVARFSVDPGTTRKNAINTLIAALKTAGVWSLLDVFYVMAAHDSQAALLNWVSTSFNGANTSGTFTTDQGFAGNGTSAFINTGFNPVTASSPHYTQNGGHIGIWSRTNNNTGTYYDVGQNITGNFGLNARSSSGSTMRGYVNTATVSNFGSNSTSIGHFILNRVVSTHHYGYFNGSPTATVAATSGALTSSSMCLLRAATNYSARELAVFHTGAGLNDTQAAALYSAINTYLVAVGAA